MIINVNVQFRIYVCTSRHDLS